MGLRMQNVNIMAIYWKIRFLGEFTKNQYIGELRKKEGGLDSLLV